MSDIKIHVPQIQIPAEAVRGLVDNLKTAQKVISPMGQRVAKVLDTQRQFFSQYQYVGFVKKSDSALTQQTPPKPEKRSKMSIQIDWDALEKELSKVKGKGYLGEQRRIMYDEYGLSVRQIWEWENPGSVWKHLSPGERKSASNTIHESIKNARKKQSEK